MCSPFSTFFLHVGHIMKMLYFYKEIGLHALLLLAPEAKYNSASSLQKAILCFWSP
jgi:hypothetical protein